MIRMPTHRWLSIGDTRLLMQLQNAGELPEWQPIAQVTLRQIYAAISPMYYAWEISSLQMIGRFETMEGAIKGTEAWVGILMATPAADSNT